MRTLLAALDAYAQGRPVVIGAISMCTSSPAATTIPPSRCSPRPPHVATTGGTATRRCRPRGRACGAPARQLSARLVLHARLHRQDTTGDPALDDHGTVLSDHDLITVVLTPI